MEIITDAQLLARIESFLRRHKDDIPKMTPSRFGREAMNDPALVFQLREAKRSLSLKNAERVVEYMRAYSPTGQAAAA